MNIEDEEIMWSMYLDIIKKSYAFMFGKELLRVAWIRAAAYQGEIK